VTTLRKSLIASLTLICALAFAGCSEYKSVNEQVSLNERTADEALQKIAPANQLAQPLMIDKRPWFGSQAVPMTNGQPLPVQFQQSDSLVLTFPGAVSFQDFARMVEASTNIRTSVSTASSGSQQGGSAETAETADSGGFVPAGADPVSGGRYVWQGRLSDLLDQAADHFDADWTFDGNAIRFDRQVTRTFMLHALAVAFDSNGSIESGSDSGSGGSGSGGDSTGPSIDLSGTVSIKIWDEMKESVTTLLGDNGRAAFSPSTGSITVSGTPEGVRRVESYLNQQNNMRLRRISVGVKVLSVTVSNDLALGVSGNELIRRVFGSDIKLTSNATSGLTVGILDESTNVANDRTNNLATLTAKEGVERVSIVHSGAVVTLSDQPAPLQVGRQISYLARTSASTGGDATSVSLEPGTVDVGLMMTVLPRIVDTNKVLMRANVSISDTQTPFPTFGTAPNQIQLPEIETTGFMQNAVLTSGETLVLAGFEKNTNSGEDNGVPGVPFIGGTRETSRSREITVLLITAEILPEEPITTIGE